jgi:pyridoxamine 5'-phosphate oxidase
MAKDISQIRRDYTGQYLNEQEVGKDPIKFFEKWFEEAEKADVLDANAFNLSTMGKDGFPDGRIVLLKGIEKGKFVFYTNYTSKKGADLDNIAKASMTFYYKELDRQIRIQGTVEKHDKEESNKYFLSRPIKSRIGAWISAQSQVIPSRIYLMRKFAEYSVKNMGKTVQRPDFWGGYALTPIHIEFWQGRPSRLHDRINFRLEDGQWVAERLSP